MTGASRSGTDVFMDSARNARWIMTLAGATALSRVQGACTPVPRLAPRAPDAGTPAQDTGLADLLAGHRPAHLLSTQPIGDLVAFQFAWHDISHVVPVHGIPDAVCGPPGDIPFGNLCTGTLSLESVYGRTPLVGDVAQRLNRVLGSPWDPARLWHAPDDVLRVNTILNDCGAPLAFSYFDQLPPHLRRLYFDEDGVKLHRAILPDLRNDSSLLLSQFHAYLIARHNQSVAAQDHTHPTGAHRGAAFVQARTAVTHGFHGFLRHHVLPDICDARIWTWCMEHWDTGILNTLPRAPSIEAILVAETLSLFLGGHRLPLNRAPDSDWTWTTASALRPDCAHPGLPRQAFNSARVPEHIDDAHQVDWSLFVPGQDQPALTLADLAPAPADATTRRLDCTAVLNMGRQARAPSGQTLARWCAARFDLEIPVAQPDMIRQHLGDAAPGLRATEDTPLPLYTVMEADLLGADGRLGPLASLLVALTFLRAIGPDICAQRPCAMPHPRFLTADAPTA